MLQCRDIDELMIDFLYQELETPRADAFKAHLATCPRCGQELQSLQRVRGAVRELPEAEPPQSVTAKLLHEAAKRARPVVREDERRGFAGWLGSFFKPIVMHPAWAAAASLILVLGAVVYFKARTDVSEKPQSHPGMTARAEEAKAAAPAAVPPAGGMPAQDPAPQAHGVATTTATPAEPMAPAAAPDPTANDKLDRDGYFEQGNDFDRAGRAASPDELQKLDATKRKGKSAPVFSDGVEVPEGKAGPVSRGYGATVGDGAGADDTGVSMSGGVIGGTGGGATTGATSTREGSKARPPAKKAKEAQKEAEPAEEDAYDGELAVEAPARPEPKPADSKPADAPGKVVVAEKTPAQEPAPPPPAPPRNTKDAKPTTPPQTTSAPRRDANADTKTGGKNAAPAKTEQARAEDPKKLHEMAKKQANSGECEAALTTRGRIQRVDADYYKRNVQNDKAFAPCDKRVQDERKRRQKQMEESVPAPADDAAADAPASTK